MTVPISEFYCTKCGTRGISIPRDPKRKREAGHLKKLYCVYCGEERNHAEVKNEGKYHYEDFLIEFEEDNFTEEGKRKEPWKMCVNHYFEKINKKPTLEMEQEVNYMAAALNVPIPDYYTYYDYEKFLKNHLNEYLEK